MRLLVLGLNPFAKVFAKLIPIAALQKAVEEGGKGLSGPAERWLRKSRRSVEFLVTRILRNRSPYERILRRDLRLAVLCMRLVQAPNKRLTSAVEARVRKVKGSALGAVLETLGPSLLVELSRDGASWWVREDAAEALAGAAQEPAVWEQLVELSRDEDFRVRVRAAEALAGTAQEPAVWEWLVKLSRDENWMVRKSATEALAGAAQALRDDTFRAEVLCEASRRAKRETVFWKLLEAAVQVAEERG